MMQGICENCEHFRQHYVKRGKGYTRVNCGHCVHPRIKKRLPNTTACDHYREKVQENP